MEYKIIPNKADVVKLYERTTLPELRSLPIRLHRKIFRAIKVIESIRTDLTGEKRLRDIRGFLLREISQRSELIGLKTRCNIVDFLSSLFLKRIKIGDTKSTLGAYSIFEDMGSGSTVSFEPVTSYFKHKGIMITPQEEEGIYNVYQSWSSHFAFATHDKDELSKKRSQLTYETNIQAPVRIHLVNPNNVHPTMIDITTTMLLMMPSGLLSSSLVKHRLRGGINLQAQRLLSSRYGHYDEEAGQLGVQKTVFSLRSFAETLGHELGHVIQPLFLDDRLFKYFYTVVQRTDNFYSIPALGESAEGRSNYIRSSIEDFWAETFMHYLLHREYFSMGFLDLVNDNELWHDIYCYIQDKLNLQEDPVELLSKTL